MSKERYQAKASNKKKHKFGSGKGGYGAIADKQITPLAFTAIEPSVVEDEALDVVQADVETVENLNLSDDLNLAYGEETDITPETLSTDEEFYGEELSDTEADEIENEIEDYSATVYLNEDGEAERPVAPTAPYEAEAEEVSDEVDETELEKEEVTVTTAEPSETQEELIRKAVEKALYERALQEQETLERLAREEKEKREQAVLDAMRERDALEAERNRLKEEELLKLQLVEEERAAKLQAEEEAKKQAEEEARRQAEEEEKRMLEEIENARRLQDLENERQRKALEEALQARQQELLRKEEELNLLRQQQEEKETAMKQAEEEARRQAEEEARRQAEEEARRQAEEEARKQAEEEARRQAEEEARRQAEEEARKQAEEEARRQAEEEARKQAEEEARRQAEEEARRQAEEEARKQAEEERMRIQAQFEEMRRQQEEENNKLKQALEEALRAQKEELLQKQRELEEIRENQRLAEERHQAELEEQRRLQREAEERRIAEEEARRQAEEEARRQAEEEARRQAEEEARRQAEEEARRQAEEEARRQAEEEARRQAEEEARRQAEEAERIRLQEELEEMRRQQEENDKKYYVEEEEEMYNQANVAKIKVIGVGGAGSNAVNRMIELGVDTAEFVAVNTDKQALLLSLCDEENKIQIGANVTKGLGAGADPTVGEQSAEESKKAIEEAVKGVDLLFIAAGMGGGTGTGAAPIVAKIAKEAGCVTVAVVTRPFHFEGKKREMNAIKGVNNLAKYVDTIIIIPNDRLLEALPADTPFVDALKYADDTLRQGICGIADLIATPSLINLDFADVRTILKNQGLAHMGVGKAKGENRVIEAVRQAVASPLLETTIEGAHGIILNVTGGKDLSMQQVKEAADRVQEIIDPTANIIFGMNVNPELQEEIIITIIATGFDKKVGEDEDVQPKPSFAFQTNPSQPKAEPREEFMTVQRSRFDVKPQETNVRTFRNEERPYEPTFPERVKQEEVYEEPTASETEPEETNVNRDRKLPSFVSKLFGKRN